MRVQALLLVGLACTSAVPLSKRQYPGFDLEIPFESHDGIGDDGFYYNWFTHVSVDPKNPDSVSKTGTFTNGANGTFAASWRNTGYMRGGKGWKHGSGRNVTYDWESRFQGVVGMGGIYGRSKDPLVEYHIVDTYLFGGFYGVESKGELESDGDVYRFGVLSDTFYDSDGTQHEVTRYFSVRKNPRFNGGTIDTKAHFDAWASVGMELDETSDFMIVAVDDNYGTGSAKFTVYP